MMGDSVVVGRAEVSVGVTVDFVPVVVSLLVPCVVPPVIPMTAVAPVLAPERGVAGRMGLVEVSVSFSTEGVADCAAGVCHQPHSRTNSRIYIIKYSP